MINWTNIILALINTVGAVLTAVFATRAKQHATVASTSAGEAVKSADIAKAASLRPPANVVINSVPPPSEPPTP
jgi:hypothetical protein